MKYDILATGRFRKDLKAIMNRGYNIQLLQDAVSLLAAGRPLPEKNKIKLAPSRKFPHIKETNQIFLHILGAEIIRKGAEDMNYQTIFAGHLPRPPVHRMKWPLKINLPLVSL